MKKIVFYKNVRGDSPVEEFLERLPDKQAQKVAWVLRIIRDLDFVPKEYFKKLVSTDLWEEIELAAKRMKEYLNRSKGNG